MAQSLCFNTFLDLDHLWDTEKGWGHREGLGDPGPMSSRNRVEDQASLWVGDGGDKIGGQGEECSIFHQ